MLLLGFFATPVLGSGTTARHGLQFALAPLRLSQYDLLVILQRVHNLVRSANQTSEDRYVQENLAISGGGLTITLEGEPRFIDSF